jgi:hypothetical protein
MPKFFPPMMMSEDVAQLLFGREIERHVGQNQIGVDVVAELPGFAGEFHWTSLVMAQIASSALAFQEMSSRGAVALPKEVVARNDR